MWNLDETKIDCTEGNNSTSVTSTSSCHDGVKGNTTSIGMYNTITAVVAIHGSDIMKHIYILL